MAEREKRASPMISPWVPVYRDMVNPAKIYPRFLKAIFDSLSRQPSPVLHPAKAFLLRGGNRLAIQQQTGSRVSMIRVNSQDKHRGSYLSDNELRFSCFGFAMPPFTPGKMAMVAGLLSPGSPSMIQRRHPRVIKDCYWPLQFQTRARKESCPFDFLSESANFPGMTGRKA